MSALREDADVETSSEGYARRFSGPVGAFFLQTQSRAALELLAPFPGASILEVGGGHGQLTGPLVDAGHAVTVFGSDARCRERVRAWVDTGRARFEAGDLLAMPFPDRSFDVVVSLRLLPHVRSWQALVAELCRVALRSVVVDYPTRRSVNVASGALFPAKRSVEGNTRPFVVFRDAEIVDAFARQGFLPTGRRPQFFLPMALHRAVGSAVLSRSLEGVAKASGLVGAFGSPVILRLEPRRA
ncbi:MAG TPA: class I SAM-dependent methyltransferase [Vicinamibacteria bacterium]|nr:class I SAM-dependent methyltransferase [Vicinamibacteria bacterium]